VSNQRGLLTRLRVKLTPQFLEDWLGAAGQRFRKTGERLSNYNRDHARVGEKVDEAPGLLWKAARGAANTQLAKAEADYAKAENDRIETELKKRTMEAKARHESADADKAEAEAGVAKIREIQARLELFKQLKDIGVNVTIDSSMNLAVGPRNTASAPLVASDALEAEEIEQIQPNLVAVRCPDLSFGQDVTKIVLTRWIAHVGTRVEADEPIYELSTPAVDSEIPSPAAGILVEVLIQESSAVVKGQVLATILTDAVVSKDTGDPPLTREFIAAWRDFETQLNLMLRRLHPDVPKAQGGIGQVLSALKSTNIFSDAERGAINMLTMKRNDAVHSVGAPDKGFTADEVAQVRAFADRLRGLA
jgi:biotin carboxyl carrier protein